MNVTNWDIDKYKSEHESEELWKLRKEFLTKHRDKYPETKLLSLAQVFVNIEYLGCRYPKKTMQLVAELSKGMADEYRKKRKGKLKRTFAESSCPTIGNVKDVSETPVKVLITDQNISTNSDYQYSCPKHSELIKQPSYEYSEFSKFILYENCNSFGELQTCPIIILLQSAEKNGFKDSLRFCYPGDSRNSKHEKYCELRFDGKVLSSGTGKSKREAKMNAAIEGLNRLRKTCFTIQEKNVFLSQNLTNIKDGEINTSYPPIPQDNIGSKMMQKMGWTGNGLGKHQQGMQTPIQIMSAKPKQQGFGHWNKMSAKEKFKCFFKKYMTNETSSELIFDPDALSPDDCQIIREVGSCFPFKTRSYSANNKTRLMIYKKETLQAICRKLILCHGENDRYLLINPDGIHFRSPEESLSIFDDCSKESKESFSNVKKQEGKIDTLTTQTSDFESKELPNIPTANNPIEINTIKNEIKNKPCGKPNAIQKHIVTLLDLFDKKISPTVIEDLPLNLEEFSTFVLFEHFKGSGQLTSSPSQILHHSFQMVGQKRLMKYHYPSHKNFQKSSARYCEILVNNKLLSSGVGNVEKAAKRIAAEKGLKSLRKICCTIREKCTYLQSPGWCDDSVRIVNLEDGGISRDVEQVIEDWDDLTEQEKQKQDSTVQLFKSMNMNDESDTDCSFDKRIKDQFKLIFKYYNSNNYGQDLVFKSDLLSTSERKAIHLLAARLNLRTKIYGNDSDRCLVVSKMLKPVDILKMLISCGGENEKYALIPPEDADESWYPEETMKLVAKLSEGVANEHRERQKGKLKRTFVQASDAVISNMKRDLAKPPQKKIKSSQEDSVQGFQYSQFVHATGVIDQPPQLSKEKPNISEFSGFILFEYGNATFKETCPAKILHQSAQKKGQKRVLKFNFPTEKNKQQKKYCEISIDNEILSSGRGSTVKEAKEIAAEEGLNKLRKTCYTIQVKQAFFSDNPSLTKDNPVQETDLPIPQDNIGSKMMQKMGWTGSGLGKQQQGIQTPVQASSQIVQRAGIGCTNHHQLQGRFREVFQNYIASKSDHDLVFASDFSSEERKTLHQLARKFNLRTKSFGKDNDRHLVVSKMLAPVDLLELLLDCGGENEKYLLISPTDPDET
ncbi:uncharacterized protein LOC124359544 isoform X6 [Homalodisca vitripennis]|nr:uncharacterized protein LOC124359544 isoform X5 [Homalodisca vitripennis]XP_046668327.1 uncharacterized protein LOC124359544 isoform X6 [Homalodisca vitripennis]